MVASNFPACLDFTLRAEGGWSNNPADPGGATMKGVTLRTFRHFYPGSTVSQLRNITDAQLARIYHIGYWEPVHGDDMPSGVDLVCFDMAVNAGPGRSVIMLQDAVGAHADGVIGPRTLAAIQATKPLSIINSMIEAQRAYYRSLATFSTFGKGWLARTQQRLDTALAMVSK